jgi:hypothetical protein
VVVRALSKERRTRERKVELNQVVVLCIQTDREQDQREQDREERTKTTASF